MEKGRLGSMTYTGSEPHTMVIHLEDTAIAGGAVVRALWFWSNTLWTPPKGVEGDVVLIVIEEGTRRTWIS